MTRTFLVTGAGGVGKTTVSAAFAIGAAAEGASTLVLTVDPAKRLADALGLEHLGNEPSPVGAGTSLHAAMLDVSASWEAILHRHAPPDEATRLLANPFFRAIADRFPAAQSYAAGEQMLEYIESDDWDVLVIDTPPSAGGIDFFTAPRGIQELVGGRLLRWLTGARLPARRTLYRIAARPALRFADAVLGGPLLEEVAEFLLDLRTLYDGLTQRAKAIEAQLSRATTMVISTADPTPLREARRFFEELSSVAVVPAVVVFNRTLPESWSEAIAQPLPANTPPELRTEVRDNLARWAAESRRQADARQEFGSRHRVAIATIPWFAQPPTSLDALARLLEAAKDLPAPA